MRCGIKFEELSLYLDGKYKGAKGQALDKHIAECPGCKEQLEKLRSLKASLAALAPVKESEGFDFEFNRLLEERLSARGSAVLRWKAGLERALAKVIYPAPAFVRVAASFILVVAMGLGARVHILHKAPFVEFVAGEVKIYKPSQKQWVRLQTDMKLKAGDKIHSRKGAIYNIVSRGKYKARVKDNSVIVIAKLKNGWRNIDTDFSIPYGNLLVNTTEDFKGSKMNIYTPSCDAEVVGTAFIIKALGQQTWLGVLEGKVKVVSKVHPLKAEAMRKATVFVSSGQKIIIKPYQYPTRPELFSEKEWLMVQELYQLTQEQKIILLIGTGSDRIEELLGPAPVYISGVKQMAMPENIPVRISVMIDAIKDGNYETVSSSAKDLEELLREHPDPKYDVEILMFIASHYHHIRDYDNALRIFKKVIGDYPDSSLASLAQCAVATIYLQDLKDVSRAEMTYRQLLEVYPNSVDAIRAKEALFSIR